MSLPIQIIVGGSGAYDPVVGASITPAIPALAGVDYYVTKAGYGNYDYEKWQRNDDGSLQLLLGITFGAGERFFLTPVAVDLNLSVTNPTYTNGYNLNLVINALYGRIGWRQSPDSSLPVLTSPNTTSRSGRYFDGFHSLVNERNLKAVCDYAGITDADFNTYLTNLQKDSIMQALNGCLNGPEYIEQVLEFDNEYRIQRRAVTNSGLFVGRQIKVANAMDIAVQVDSVRLLFDSDITFNLYCFKEGKKTAIWAKEVSAIADEATVVNIDDLVLNYISTSTKGSVFYIGYFQDALGSVKAIDENPVEWEETKCFCIEPVQSLASGADFDRVNISYPSTTFGLCFEVSSFRDHTNQIVKKANLFDELIGLQLTYKVLEAILYTVRSNGEERILREQVSAIGLQLEMQGAAPISDSPQITGLNKRIQREIERVKSSLYHRPKAQTVNLAEC